MASSGFGSVTNDDFVTAKKLVFVWLLSFRMTTVTVSTIYYVSSKEYLYSPIPIPARYIYRTFVIVVTLSQKEVYMREKTIERKLVEAVKAIGGIAPKFVSPGFDGMPDRLVLLPSGKIAFVEVKRRGENPRPLQEARHGMLRRLGFQVYVLDDAARIPRMMKEMGGDAR